MCQKTKVSVCKELHSYWLKCRKRRALTIGTLHRNGAHIAQWVGARTSQPRGTRFDPRHPQTQGVRVPMPAGALSALEIRRPSVGVFRPRQRGRFTSPLPPSAGPLRRPSGPKPRGAALKLRSPTAWPDEACKNHVPQGGVPPEGHFGATPKFLCLGFEVLELPPGTCEAGFHTSGTGLRTCRSAPRGCRRRPMAARSAATAEGGAKRRPSRPPENR